jgi:putative phage-type endonuclease
MKVHAPQKFNEAKLVGVFESGSQEWHEARSGAIGGSEMGSIMGLNPWESAVSLMAKKLDLIPNPPIDNWAVKFGQKFEEPILELFQEEHPDFEIFTTGTYQSAERPYLHANPDALAKVNGEWVIVEVKTSKNYWYEIPPAYIAQVRHYMAVMDVNKAVIVGVVNMSWVEHWIERDDFEERVILQYAEQFHRLMENQKLPEWDGAESTYQAVREMHPLITDEEVEIDGGHLLIAAQEQFDKAQAELLEAKSRVMAAMGNAKHAFVEHQGERFRIASRQARGLTAPYLVINKKGK